MDVDGTRREVWKLFDRIAGRYDFLNRLLSMRQDVAWRKKMARYLPTGTELNLLDLATGTGDQILFLLEATDRIAKAVGIDLSENMLALGQKKVAKMNLGDKIALRTGDGASLDFDDNSFDVATISFGIRNIPDYRKALREMFRVVKPGGRALILEFSLPSSAVIRKPYLFYFRHILPQVGSTLSGDSMAYKYLNNTVEGFPHGEEFLKEMATAGFTHLERHPLTFGIATIYVGVKEKAFH